MFRGWGWKLASLPVCVTTCRATAQLFSPYKNRSSQFKDSFPFFPSLQFWSFSSISCSHAPSLFFFCPLDWSFYCSSLVWVCFFSTLFAATTFLTPLLIQHKAYSPFPRSLRKSCPFYHTVVWSPPPFQRAEGNTILSSPFSSPSLCAPCSCPLREQAKD